jgi:hypothetical protein
MKIRAVWCIHIAAFLFSVLILSLTSFSYYRAILLDGYFCDRYTHVIVSEGRVLFHRIRMKVNRPWTFELLQPRLIAGIFEGYQEGIVAGTERRFLNVIYLAAFESDLEKYFIISLRPLLLPPIAWLSGFYLVSLRRRFRSGRSDSPTRKSAPDVPSDRPGE